MKYFLSLFKMFYVLFLLVCQVFCNVEDLQGWKYITLHCRDNNNEPVDWWILYKPPSGDGPYWESGRNFTYITSRESGKWEPSNKLITSSSMLQFTLAPMLRSTYTDHIAQLTYHSMKIDSGNFGSSAHGILLAEDMGGVWVLHTVPKLPDMIRQRESFPAEEIGNGHMVMCLSVDLDAMNKIARSLRLVQPNIQIMEIPPSMKEMLPDWKNIVEPDGAPVVDLSLQQTVFRTSGNTVNAAIVVRPPGDQRCLYRTFAMNMKIVLDVYGHDTRMKTLCARDYSVRNVDAISLKYSDNILYVNNETDRFGFAVSTAAHWQRRGGAPDPQYWVCVGSMEKEDFSGKGGLVLCLEDYSIWRSFDMLKIKEPVC